MTILDEINALIDKGDTTQFMSQGDHYYLKAIAISLREILKRFDEKGVVPNFVIIDPSCSEEATEVENDG